MNSTDPSPAPNTIPQAERIDELDRYYTPVGQLDDWISRIYWVSAFFSIAVLYKNQIPWPQVQWVPEFLFALSVILHVILSAYLRLNLFPLAESKRRQQLLSDSFGVPLISEKTQKYYNNDLSPSLTRLGANILENALFAKTITAKMLDGERKIILIYFTIWIFLWRGAELGLVVAFTQFLFSSEIVGKWLRLELLRRENEKYYDELYHEFLHKIDLTDPILVASILDKFAAYEVAKGMTGVRLSKTIFSALNSQISAEWDSVRKKLGID